MYTLLLSFFSVLGINSNLLETFSKYQPLNLEEKYEGKIENYKYKYNRLDLIAKFIPEDPVILEAGSNRGEDTIRIASKWPRGHVLAFEAFPEVYNLLQKNLHRLNNVCSFPYALAEKNGFITFYLSETQYPASSILDRTEYVEKQFGGRNIQVQAFNLDSFCNQNSLPKIDFMWLDLEGAELLILSSSPKILSTVKCIYTETNFQKFRHGTVQYNDLKNFLESAGFELIAHWYHKDWQGDAIFVRKELKTNN